MVQCSRVHWPAEGGKGWCRVRLLSPCGRVWRVTVSSVFLVRRVLDQGNAQACPGSIPSLAGASSILPRVSGDVSAHVISYACFDRIHTAPCFTTMPISLSTPQVGYGKDVLQLLVVGGVDLHRRASRPAHRVGGAPGLRARALRRAMPLPVRLAAIVAVAARRAAVVAVAAQRHAHPLLVTLSYTSHGLSLEHLRALTHARQICAAALPW